MTRRVFSPESTCSKALPWNQVHKTWINVRLVAEGVNKGGALKLYVNGELALTSALTSDIDGINSVELFTPSTHNGQGFTEGSIYLDNTYLGGQIKQETEEPDVPTEPGIPDGPTVEPTDPDEVGNNGENMDSDGWIGI